MKIMIDSYEFGRIVVDGRVYTSDLIIFGYSVMEGWWRREGHKLCVEDLEEIVRRKPEVLVVGTGYYGLMKVPEEVERYLSSKGIELIIQKTGKAYRTFNELLGSGRKVAVALHLTC